MTGIRAATPADLAAIVRVDDAAFGAQRWSESAVSAELAAAGRIVLVDGIEPVTAWASVAVAADVADLLRIGVHPDARRRGLARRMLAEAARSAREAGADRMLLEVAEHNAPALTLYHSCGFERLAVRRDYYPGGVDAVVMERAL